MNRSTAAVIGSSVRAMLNAAAMRRAMTMLSRDNSSLMPFPQPFQWVFHVESTCSLYKGSSDSVRSIAFNCALLVVPVPVAMAAVASEARPRAICTKTRVP